MEHLDRAVELEAHPITRVRRIIKGAAFLGLTALSLWSFISHHEVIGGLFLLLLATMLWRELRARSISVNSEGIRVVFKYTGRTHLFRWQEISRVEVACHGKDMDDMDFCHHVVFVTNGGEKIRTDDHFVRNYSEFVATAQKFLVGEEQKRALDAVIERYIGVRQHEAD